MSGPPATRSVLVAAASAVVVALYSCADPLDELAPFPCATDGTCPGGYTCIGGSCIEGLPLDSACGTGARCANADCVAGICVQHCGKPPAAICGPGRVCSYPPEGEVGPGAYCIRDCANEPCPAGQECEGIYDQTKACVTPSAKASLDRTCTTPESCQTQFGLTYLPITCSRGTCAPFCATPQVTCADPKRFCHLVDPVITSGCLPNCTEPGTVCPEGLVCKPSPFEEGISMCSNPAGP
jgi:hypothetical protein